MWMNAGRREGRWQPFKGDITPAWLLLTRATVGALLQWRNTRQCTSSALFYHFAGRKPAFLSCSLLAPLMPEARGGKWVRGRWNAPEEKLVFGSRAGVLFVCFLAVGLVSLLRVKGKSVSEAAEWGGERSGKISMTKSAHWYQTSGPLLSNKCYIISWKVNIWLF